MTNTTDIDPSRILPEDKGWCNQHKELYDVGPHERGCVHCDMNNVLDNLCGDGK